MKNIVGFWVLYLSLQLASSAQVDTTYIYNTSMPYGTLDIRLAKSATRYYYLQENRTFSFRESSGVKTNSYRNMTSWNSDAYTQGNLRERNGNADYFILNYRLLFPSNYNATYSPGYPLIIMMHGFGERGNCWERGCYHADRSWNPNTNNPPAPTNADHQLMNNDHNLLHGGKPHLDARNAAGSRLPNDPNLPLRSFPGFVLFPQNLNGWTGATVQDAIRLVRLVAKKYNVDPNRIYIHGLSNGGYAVYETIKRAPWLFAAALPMSAVSDASIVSQNLAPKIAHIPLWIFQGGTDTNPTPAKTMGYIKKFREAGAVVRYNLYPELGHGVWNKAYSEPDFFRWMLQQNKTQLHAFAGVTAICRTNGQGVRLALAEGFHRYQWERNGVIISGANAATYVATTTGVYRARFSRKPNPGPNDWNPWSNAITITEQNPAQAQIQQIGTVHLRDLNNFADAKLKSVNEAAHYYWYKDNVLVDLPGTQDDTIRYPTFKQGDCTANCTGNGLYTLVTAGFDNCPSPRSEPIAIFFNNQAPININPPGNFTGTVLSQSSVRLNWTDASSNEKGFEIWNRKKTGTTTFSKWEMRTITKANITTFTDNGLEPSTTYQYKIRAVGNSGRSDYTPAASNQFLTVVTGTDTTPPSVPQNVTATATGINTITLQWSASTDNSGIRQYRIQYGSQTVQTGSSATRYVLTNLTLNTNYSFTVRAEDLAGNISTASAPASANTFVTGLYYEHSTGAWSSIDAINWNIVEFSGKVNNFTLAPRTQEDYFNFKFDGYLYIQTGGTYQFRTTSSDGSRVELDGVIVVNNDGVHDNRTITGPNQTLSSGPKRITVKYFEFMDGQSLTVQYKGPDTNNAWVSVPDAALRSSGSSSMMLARAASEEEDILMSAPETESALLFSVYPNPATSQNINIQFDTYEETPLLVRLVDLSGKPVYEDTFLPEQLQQDLRIEAKGAVNSGVYLLIIQQNNHITKKLVAIRN